MCKQRRAILHAAVSMPLLSSLPSSLLPLKNIVELADGSAYPLAMFGVQIYDNDVAYDNTMRAIEAGFRAFFTSPEAGNQFGFAQAVRDSGLPREAVYIAGSILSDNAENYRNARALTARECDASLQTLAQGGVNYLDMLLLERPAIGGCAAILGQWKECEARRMSGVARSLGVCNFSLREIDCLKFCAYRPQLNQIPFNLAVRMPHAQLLTEHRARGVILQSWGPLGGPSGLIPKLILDECGAVGNAHRRKTKAQVALRWIVQQDVAFVVHSRSSKHLCEDLDVFDWELTADEMASLTRNSERAPEYC